MGKHEEGQWPPDFEVSMQREAIKFYFARTVGLRIVMGPKDVQEEIDSYVDLFRSVGYTTQETETEVVVIFETQDRGHTVRLEVSYSKLTNRISGYRFSDPR